MIAQGRGHRVRRIEELVGQAGQCGLGRWHPSPLDGWKGKNLMVSSEKQLRTEIFGLFCNILLAVLGMKVQFLLCEFCFSFKEKSNFYFIFHFHFHSNSTSFLGLWITITHEFLVPFLSDALMSLKYNINSMVLNIELKVFLFKKIYITVLSVLYKNQRESKQESGFHYNLECKSISLLIFTP